MAEFGQAYRTHARRQAKARRFSLQVLSRGLFGLGLAGCLWVAGCAEIQIRSGIRPHTEVVEKSLVVGKSTRADVRSVLGEPHEIGRAHV